MMMVVVCVEKLREATEHLAEYVDLRGDGSRGAQTRKQLMLLLPERSVSFQFFITAPCLEK
jgi:hypothetical protein